MMIKPHGYVNAEYLRRVAGPMADIKRQSYELMHISSAQCILDAGCGPGIDTVAMANLVSDGAKITGVDMDPEMIQTADMYAREQGAEGFVRHVLADVHDLPFEDDSFDACRAERLFQNIPATYDYTGALREILRVLKSGGRLVLIDPDYASASVDVPDVGLERMLMQYCATDVRPNGLVARRFYELLKSAGVTDVEVKVDTLVFTQVEDSPFGKYLVDEALKTGAIDQSKAAQWLDALRAREQAGTFFATLNFLTVAGTKA